MRIIFSVIEIRTVLEEITFLVENRSRGRFYIFLKPTDKFRYLFAIHSVGWNTIIIQSDGFSRVLLNSSVEAIFDRISD